MLLSKGGVKRNRIRKNKNVNKILKSKKLD